MCPKGYHTSTATYTARMSAAHTLWKHMNCDVEMLLPLDTALLMLSCQRPMTSGCNKSLHSESPCKQGSTTTKLNSDYAIEPACVCTGRKQFATTGKHDHARSTMARTTSASTHL